ncbi:MAG TPA: penicillin-binding protein 2 [Caproicibacter sp.]|nr:penicillin-binding protein 2 [Caproicibacter sp.]
MAKRAAALFVVFMLTMFLSVLTIFHLSNGTELAEAAAQQQTCKVTVAATRGTIYDCSLNPLTGDGGEEFAASVVPTIETTKALNQVFSPSEMQSVYTILTDGKPFTLKLPKKITVPGIDVFTIQKRYSDRQTAVHTLGYLDGSGKGAAGIEKAFDSQLSAGQGKITVSYPVDAMNRVLSQQQKVISDTSNLQNSGVVLTLDKSIQNLAEQSASKYLKKGAVVVLEVPSGKIRAMVSLPSFSPNNVASVLNSADSPLLNRATSAYSVGSVFKLAAAASALEYGLSPDESYTCTGSIDVDKGIFHCFDSEKHGKENMKQAIANSCNTYFVNLMQKVPHANFLLMTQMLGFGRSFQIAPGMASDAGVLPDLKSLDIPRALANFSFGQGDLTATPLQIAGMVNAIASDGNFTQPYLYEGTVNANRQFTQKAEPQKSTNVMSEKTAALLRDFMKASIDVGTSKKGKPTYGTAGAKTATAQTGKYVNGVEAVESWFAGFYPYEKPKYVIVVFAEGGDGGGTTCGPVFRDIADGLYNIL